jgi:hypothetical protein
MPLTRRDWITGSSALALASAGGAFAQAAQPGAKQFVIDCYGHYTTQPSELGDYRKAQIAALPDPAKSPPLSSLRIGFPDAAHDHRAWRRRHSVSLGPVLRRI